MRRNTLRVQSMFLLLVTFLAGAWSDRAAFDAEKLYYRASASGSPESLSLPSAGARRFVDPEGSDVFLSIMRRDYVREGVGGRFAENSEKPLWYLFCPGEPPSRVTLENYLDLTEELEGLVGHGAIRVDLLGVPNGGRLVSQRWNEVRIRPVDPDGRRLSVLFRTNSTAAYRRFEATVRRYYWGYRAVRKLDAGAAFDRDDLERVPVLSEAAWYEVRVAFHYPSRPVPAGAIIRRDDVGRVEIVERGKPIRVTVRRGTVEVELDGTALSGGAMGDAIPVRIDLSGARIVGRVADRGRVDVLLD